MREMQMVYAVMVPVLFSGNGYVAHDPLFGDKAQAEHEAERLTEIAHKHNPALSKCYVKAFALVSQEEVVENREESMSKAYFERTEPDKRHRVTIRLMEVGPCSAQVEVTTNATSGELGLNGTQPTHCIMQLGTPQQGFTVVVED